MGLADSNEWLGRWSSATRCVVNCVPTHDR